MNSYLLTADNLTVFHDSNLYTFPVTHISWDKMMEALKQGDLDRVIELGDTKRTVVGLLADTALELRDGDTLWYQSLPLPTLLTKRILDMHKQGFSLGALEQFAINLSKNPSYRSREQLYGFLEKNQHPLTPDGCFLAYKRVGYDYLDCHTHTVSNKIGETVEMERHLVDDDPNRTCSAGLHACGFGYLSSYVGDHLMVVKINPADVVSVPTDYDNAKLRCCKYTVVDELPVSLIQERETHHWDREVVGVETEEDDETLDEGDDYNDEEYGIDDEETEEEIIN